ncbi:MAG: DUF4097 domain-containing protein [bacterium]|nr:DUF4097 domain-containing protein [bacterium]
MNSRPTMLTLAVGLCACAGGCTYDHRYSVEESRDWPASEVSSLEVQTVNGRITVAVEGSDPITADIERWVSGRDQADAEEHIDCIEIDELLSGGNLRLEADQPKHGPRDYGATFEISTTALQYMDLQTSNGKVEVSGHDGDLDVQTTNGSVTADMIAFAKDGVVEIWTTNGGIDLVLPADVSATFEASTTNGGIDIVGFDDVDLDADGRTHKTGTLGGGDATITLSTTNGGITIVAD